MATIRKIAGKWRVEIRIKGFKQYSFSCNNKRLAQRISSRIEKEMKEERFLKATSSFGLLQNKGEII